MRTHPENRSPEPRGFTLIELLTVISIIGILAAMIIPAIATAKTKARVAITKTEISTIVGAIQQYYDKYNRMPAAHDTQSSRGGSSPDFTYGTVAKPGDSLGGTLLNKNGQALPGIGNVGASPRQANNAELVAVLKDLLRFRDGSALMDWEKERRRPLNEGHALNPQQFDFLDGFKELDYARAPSAGALGVGKPGGVGPDGVLRDPFGNPFIVTLDLDYDGKTVDGFYRRATVSMQNGDVGFNGLRRISSGDNFAAGGTVMVWSLGPDGLADPARRANEGVNKDNILSWK